MKPTLALHKLPLYNTGRLDDNDIITAFSARQPMFERVIADLSAEKPKSRAQHHLIVGQRGMGKTMLLARIAAEIRTGPMAERLIPLVFAEEQYAVDRLSKFWLNCLDSLADAQDQLGSTDCAAKIDATVETLNARLAGTPKDDAPLAHDALEAFLDICRTIERRPVLLVDNLQLVFERLSQDQQHALREALMRPACPILVGASPSPPKESQDYGAAFYDHFKVHYLRPLEVEEMKSLMLHLATVADLPKVRDRILNHPERLSTLRQLTGGNPRTTATLFFLYAEDFAPSVFGDLENLLDRMTPLYKARFEELSTQQQVIASAIANHWDPVTSRTLSEITGLPMTGISPQLDRLEKTGFIERVELFGKASKGIQIAERFFNIWFLMRSASRRQRREVEFLTRFIEDFYEAQERPKLASINTLCSILPAETKDKITKKLQPRSSTSPEEWCIWSHVLESRLGAIAAAEHALESAIEIEPSNPSTWNELGNFLGKYKDRWADAETAYRKAIALDPEFKMPWRNLGTLLGDKLDRPEEAESAFKTAIELDNSYAIAWGELGRLYMNHLLRFDKAEEAYRKAIEADPEFSLARRNLGILLDNRLSRYEEAETVYRETLSLDPSFIEARCDLCELISNRFSRHQEAAEIYREGTRITPKSTVMWFKLGRLLLDKLDQFDEAANAFRQSLKLDPNNSSKWNSIGNVYLDHLRLFSEAGEAFDKALELDPQSECALQNLIFLQRDFLGKGSEALELFSNSKNLQSEFLDTFSLQEALFSAYESNWGLTCDALARALEHITNGFPNNTIDDWMRASAVLIHLNYGEEFLVFLKQRRDDLRLRPWYEALKALHLGDRGNLLNIAPEIRTTAESYYDQIERRLKALPDSTGRRPANRKTKKR